MPRYPLVSASSLRRPAGPRCHGGASSLLRLASATLPQRAVAVRASTWREFDAATSAIEHVVRRPLCAPGATLWS